MNPINKVLEIEKLVKNPFGDYPTLSTKEKLVAKLSIKGYSNDKIAEMTDYSRGSVQAYMIRICTIVGCRKQELAGVIFEKIKKIVESNGEIHS